MDHKLKIILGETSKDTKIYVNDKKVGWIQDIKLSINAYELNYDIEVTFPCYSALINAKVTDKLIGDNIKLLKNFSNIKIKFLEIDTGEVKNG